MPRPTAPLPIRGLMLDLARLTDRLDTYLRLMPMLSRWGFNTLQLHLADSEGTALRFPSHPELSRPISLSPGQMRRLVAEARAFGIGVVPELECLGHTAYIHGLRRYAGLRDTVAGRMFSALCPVHPRTRVVLADLLGDVADIFQPRFIHAGLDEVAFGDHPLTAKALRTHEKHELFAAHVCWLHERISSAGCRMMMWGDHVRPEPENPAVALDRWDLDIITPRIAQLLPRDIVICDWQYEPDVQPRHVDRLLRMGFKVVGCPAVARWGTFIQPGEPSLENVAAFSRVAAARVDKDMLGVIATAWETSTCLPGTLLHAVAWAGEVMQHAGRARPHFAERFVRSEFGVQRTAAIARALEQLHTGAPHVLAGTRGLPRWTNEFGTASAEQLRQLRRAGKGCCLAAATLRRTKSQVRANADLYEHVQLGADVMAGLHRRAAAFRRVRKDIAAGQRGASVLAPVRAELAEARGLYARFRKCWDRTRHRADPHRDDCRNRLGTYTSWAQRMYGMVKLLRRVAARPQCLLDDK